MGSGKNILALTPAARSSRGGHSGASIYRIVPETVQSEISGRLLPSQEKADIAGHAARIFEHLGLETRLDLQRLRLHRFDENLAKIMRVTPSGTRALLLFATDPAQPAMLANGIETSR